MFAVGMDKNAVVLTVGIDRSQRPLEGWVEQACGSREYFVGTLEMLALLERALHPSDQAEARDARG